MGHSCTKKVFTVYLKSKSNRGFHWFYLAGSATLLGEARCCPWSGLMGRNVPHLLGSGCALTLSERLPRERTLCTPDAPPRLSGLRAGTASTRAFSTFNCLAR